MRLILTLALALPVAALSACGGSDNHDGPDADVAWSNCAGDTRPETYTLGLDDGAENGLVDFKLVSANPAPPARGDNTWLVQLDTMLDSSDAGALDGASLVVTPYMPDHQHGTPITVEVADQGSGVYQLTPVNLWMPGYWENDDRRDRGRGLERRPGQPNLQVLSVRVASRHQVGRTGFANVARSVISTSRAARSASHPV